MVPPMLLYVRVSSPERKRFGIWLPLFLLWLILLPLLALVFTVTIVVDVLLVLADQSYHHYTLLLARVIGLVGATRGMTVHVRSDGAIIDIDLV